MTDPSELTIESVKELLAQSEYNYDVLLGDDDRPLRGTSHREEGLIIALCRHFLAAHEPTQNSEAAWCKEPPKEAGWWWCRSNGGEFTVAVQVTRDVVSGKLIAWFPMTRQRESAVLVVAESEACEWAGPIEPPPAT